MLKVQRECRFHMMAENGENTSERPMWAEKGGLDFDGRARWDAWTALKGMKADRAKLEFVRVSAPHLMCSWPGILCCAHLLWQTAAPESRVCRETKFLSS